MAYIGRDTDKISNVEVLDNITFDGSSSYTLQKNSVNFTPSSANTLLVSIDGVVQAGNFTVSGSTIDFGTAVAGTSTCDFILHYGVGLITTPSDGTVTTAKLADSSVSLAKLTATGTKDATTFLRGDNTFGVPPLGGITEADQWKLTSNLQLTTNAITTNLARVNKIGTGMTESSGIFTFPSTGIYMITVNASFHSTSGAGSSRYVMVRTKTTTNNSTYNNVARAITNIYNFQTNDISTNASSILYFDVTDTSTHKVKFSANSATPSGYYLDGTSSDTYTNFNFIRLGDT